MKKRLAIICVDDERIILDSLKNELVSHFGKKLYCEIAESGEEALDLLEELKKEGFTIPLVISDCIMHNGMDGTEFLSKVRAENQSTFCVMLTGQTKESQEKVLSQKYIDKLLTKPWKSEELFTIVNQVAFAA